MDPDPDRWIDNPAFNWTPEAPLRLEPKFAAAVPVEKAKPEPRFEEPRPAPATPPESAAAEAPRAAPAATETLAIPESIAAPAVKVRAPSFFLPRILVGLIQGFSLEALFDARTLLNPYLFAAMLMALLFAPLLLLAGFGRAPLRRLLVWSLFAGLLLAAAGAYHYWRTFSSDGGHPGLALLALTGLFLFVGQSLVQAAGGDYRAHYRAAWRLAIRIVLCAPFVSLAWAATGALSSWLRQHHPELQSAPFAIPLVTLSVALAAQLTGERLLGVLQEGLVFVITQALPFVLLLAVGLVGLGALGRWQPSLGVAAVTGYLLILAINASYRDGATARPPWRLRAEFAGSLLLLPLALIAAFALAARVQQYGWTDDRIFAAASLLLMGGYATCYIAAALISLGGGGWMQRIENGNLALAFAGMMLIAALGSPVADPARLAVASQTFRLQRHQVGPDAFDFTWLRDGGLRFGRDALARMAAAKTQPALARGAFAALSAPRQAERPTPTEIGANIHVHSAHGLPAGLLARDWSNVANAPPCLTSASLVCDGFLADLDGDGRDEVILAYGSDTQWWASVMRRGDGGGWYVAGTLDAPCPGGLAALRAGQFSIVRAADNWRDLLINGVRLDVLRPKLALACPAR